MVKPSMMRGNQAISKAAVAMLAVIALFLIFLGIYFCSLCSKLKIVKIIKNFFKINCCCGRYNTQRQNRSSRNGDIRSLENDIGFTPPPNYSQLKTPGPPTYSSAVNRTAYGNRFSPSTSTNTSQSSQSWCEVMSELNEVVRTKTNFMSSSTPKTSIGNLTESSSDDIPVTPIVLNNIVDFKQHEICVPITPHKNKGKKSNSTSNSSSSSEDNPEGYTVRSKIRTWKVPNISPDVAKANFQIHAKTVGHKASTCYCVNTENNDGGRLSSAFRVFLVTRVE